MRSFTMRSEQTGVGSGTVFATLPVQGTDVSSIVDNFPAILVWAFQNNPYINTQITNMPQTGLASLSHDYYVQTGGNVAPLMTAAAQKLTAANLILMAQVFGPTTVTPYVTSYAPAAIKTQYNQLLAQLNAQPATQRYIHESQAHYAALGLNVATMNGTSTGSSAKGYTPAPQLNMAVEDIFLEFYAAGEGTTITEALVMTANYAAGPLTLAAAVGTAIGTAIYKVGDSLSPGIWADVIEYFGQPFINDSLPYGTVTVGEPYDSTVPTYTFDPA